MAKKRASKRQTLQQKYKIKKRVKDHHHKLKKGAVVGHRKKKAAENRIPNACPFKGELLQDIQRAKDKLERAKTEAKEKRAELMVCLFCLHCCWITFILEYRNKSVKVWPHLY